MIIPEYNYTQKEKTVDEILKIMKSKTKVKKHIEGNDTTIKKWIKALRSGKYKQTKRRLQDKDGYCCLGVACKLFIPDAFLRRNKASGFIEGCTPLMQEESPEWLKQISKKLSDLTGIGLIGLNDHGIPDYFCIAIKTSFPNYEIVDQSPFSFDEIADVLEMVFVLKVLDQPK